MYLCHDTEQIFHCHTPQDRFSADPHQSCAEPGGLRWRRGALVGLKIPPGACSPAGVSYLWIPAPLQQGKGSGRGVHPLHRGPREPEYSSYLRPGCILLPGSLGRAAGDSPEGFGLEQGDGKPQLKSQPGQTQGVRVPPQSAPAPAAAFSGERRHPPRSPRQGPQPTATGACCSLQSLRSAPSGGVGPRRKLKS